MSLLGRVRDWLWNLPPDQVDDAAEPGEPSDAAPPGGRVESAASRRRPGAGAELPGEAPPGAGAQDPPASIQKLSRVGLPDGISLDEAIALIRRVRGTLLEGPAVTWALRGAGVRPIPEPVRVACADILASRGDHQGALRVLEGASSTAGLILSADLHAGSGKIARAVGEIERVLARDIDAPGARERHRRWSAALGYAWTRRPSHHLDEATLVAPQGAAGPFRLLREVARGGAGVVYEAEDDLLGRRVAFKVYHGRGKDRGLLEREARTAVALAGPGVLRVLDADPEQGWVALEWVARGSVRDMLRAGDRAALSPIGRWARPLARALSRIHAAGLVHADVKPANVLLRQPHDPVLGDFGIARPAGAPAEGGSAGYLSPERLAGRASDPRDDVYGYGRVLEDVIQRLEAAGEAPGGSDLAELHALSLLCLGPDETRPKDGADLLRRLGPAPPSPA